LPANSNPGPSGQNLSGEQIEHGAAVEGVKMKNASPPIARYLLL